VLADLEDVIFAKLYCHNSLYNISSSFSGLSILMPERLPGFDETCPFLSLKSHSGVKTSLRNNDLHSQKNKFKKASSGYISSYNTANILVFKVAVLMQFATLKAICKPFSNNRLKSLAPRTHQCIILCVHRAQDSCHTYTSELLKCLFHFASRMFTFAHISCHSWIFPLTAINNNRQLLPLNLFAA
jgi:hypothetical protein